MTPLVANLTDDNNDAEIDLCEIPDIIVTVTKFPEPGHIHVLDGATGALQFMIPTAVTFSINPAIGDIDDDGIPEIVAAIGPGFGGPSAAVAFDTTTPSNGRARPRSRTARAARSASPTSTTTATSRSSSSPIRASRTTRPRRPCR